MSKTVRQTITFKASPHEVYEALMDGKKHAKFSGADVKMDRKVGGKFSVWDGQITGTNLNLIPDKKIIQSWRDSDWEEGVYSTATFSFAAIDSGTRLTFTQTGVPDDAYEDIKQGWKDFYWTPMKEFLKK